MKICKKCNRKLKIKYFLENSKTKDGLMSICINCYKKQLSDVMLSNGIVLDDLSDKYISCESIPKLSDQTGISKYKIEQILKVFGVLDDCRAKIKQKDKQCRVCKNILSIDKFGKTKYGVRYCCIECRNEMAKEYRGNNSNILKEWRHKNKDRIRKYSKNYMSERIKNDINFRIRINLRKRLNVSIKSKQKTGSAIHDLGCTIDYLIKYLEDKFYSHPITKEKMTWENWGKNGWHIDHVKPLAAFDLTDRKQFLKACHYTNLQPLWAEENLKKGCYYGDRQIYSR